MGVKLLVSTEAPLPFIGLLLPLAPALPSLPLPLSPTPFFSFVAEPAPALVPLGGDSAPLLLLLLPLMLLLLRAMITFSVKSFPSFPSPSSS